MGRFRVLGPDPERVDLETGRALRTLEGHSREVRGVAGDAGRPTDRFLDETLKVCGTWRPAVPPRTFEGHSDSVNGVAVTTDGQRPVSASHDHTLKVCRR